MLKGVRTIDAQQEVSNWIQETFGFDFTLDKQERCQRFLEEALELVQSCGMTQMDAQDIINYVYGRPIEPNISTEVGGAFTTLCALATATNVDIGSAYLADKQKRWDNIGKIRQKQEAKAQLGVGRSAHEKIPTSRART